MKYQPTVDVLKISGSPTRSKKDRRPLAGGYPKEDIIYVA